MKVERIELQKTYWGEWKISGTLDKESVPEAMRLVDESKGKTYELTLKQWRDKRTLSANAYFHALCTKLAAKLRISNDDCKKMMVRSYGTVAERNGTPVMIMIPKGAKEEDYWPYCEWVYGDEQHDYYQLYKQTHTLNTAEFARLIDGLVEECKAVGIETMPPDELARLYAQADAKNGDSCRSKGKGL